MRSTSLVLCARIGGYLLALAVLVTIERFHGLTGVASYGLLLLLTSFTRFSTFGVADLFLVRASSFSARLRSRNFSLYLAVITSLVSVIYLLLLASLAVIDTTYIEKYNLNGLGLFAIFYVLLARAISSLVIANERVSGDISILAASYVVPYTLELIVTVTSSTTDFMANILIAHATAHILLCYRYADRYRLFSAIPSPRLLLKYAIAKRRTAVVITAKSASLLQFAIGVYGGALLVRAFASYQLTIEDFALLTVIFTLLQASQNIANTPITVSQPRIIRLAKQIVSKAHLESSLEEWKLSSTAYVVAALWLCALATSVLFAIYGVPAIPTLYVDALTLFPLAMIGLAFLDLCFFPMILLQVSGKFIKVSRFMIIVYLGIVLLMLFVGGGLLKFLVVYSAQAMFTSTILIGCAFNLLSFKNRFYHRNMKLISSLWGGIFVFSSTYVATYFNEILQYAKIL